MSSYYRCLDDSIPHEVPMQWQGGVVKDLKQCWEHHMHLEVVK